MPPPPVKTTILSMCRPDILSSEEEQKSSLHEAIPLAEKLPAGTNSAIQGSIVPGSSARHQQQFSVKNEPFPVTMKHGNPIPRGSP